MKANVIIDGIQINAAHYGAMSKEDAVAAMKADGINADATDDWYGSAHDLATGAADKAAEQEAKEVEAKQKEGERVGKAAAKAAAKASQEDLRDALGA